MPTAAANCWGMFTAVSSTCRFQRAIAGCIATNITGQKLGLCHSNEWSPTGVHLLLLGFRSTQVELYLATAACESYMNKLCHLLEQLLSCQHGGQVFADKASFSNWTEDDYQSHTGIKNIKVFQLKQSTGEHQQPTRHLETLSQMFAVRTIPPECVRGLDTRENTMGQ